MKFDAIIFDLDGTLTDTIPVIFDAFHHVIKLFTGKKFSDNEIAAYFGPSEDKILSKFIPAHNISQAMDELHSFYRSNGDRIKLIPGLEKVLIQIASKKNKIGLFTGKGREGTRITFEQIGAGSYFKYIITGDDVIKPKPDPEGLERLLAMMDAAPEKTLFIGDTESDIRAGTKAGVNTGLALWTKSANKNLSVNPTYFFNSTSDLESILFQKQ